MCVSNPDRLRAGGMQTSGNTPVMPQGSIQVGQWEFTMSPQMEIKM